MASKEECDQFAAEMSDRFEQLMRWAMENWPKRDFPLLQSDFAESRREIAEIIGPKLGDCDTESESPPRRGDDSAPYRVMNPMPWP